ncbi:hypothetical protein DV736_g2345, partial [Chaetothyriales sp. CBS 134916]
MDANEHESPLRMSPETIAREWREERRKRKEAEDRVKDEQNKRQKVEHELKRERDQVKIECDQVKRERDQVKREHDQVKREHDQVKREHDQVKREHDQVKELLKQVQEGITFGEYLQLYHELGTDNLLVQDKKFCTKGTTSVEGKYYPEKILPWKGCEAALRTYYNELRNIFHPPGLEPKRLFSSDKNLGNNACRRPLSCENDVRYHQRRAVETPVESILSELIKLDPEKAEDLEVGCGVEFKDHTNSLTDNEQPTRRLASDRICIHLQPGQNQDNKRSCAFVVEYKPPHRLSGDDLRKALETPRLCQTVISGAADGEGVAAKAITQTFDYMVNLGHEYSYLTTAEAFVFLRVRRVKGKQKYFNRLYYHMVEPKKEVKDKKDFFYSAISQVASFCLMSFKSRKGHKDWLAMAEQVSAAKEKGEEGPIKIWRSADAANYLPLDDISVSESSQSSWHPSSQESASQESASQESASEESAFQESASQEYASEESAFQESASEESASQESASEESASQESASQESAAAAVDSEGNGKGDAGEGGGSRGVLGTASTASGPGPGAANVGTGRLPGHRSGSGRPSQRRGRPRRYCTQACLMGLKRASPLDGNCANVAAHRRPGDGVHHPITADDFPRLLQQQLSQSVHRHCMPLGLQGSRGALFKLTLTGYGYTFVGKGTVSSYVPDLRREGRWYRQLDKLQGDAVPVYLGNIDLTRGYYLDLDVNIVHMLLMSWGGPCLVSIDGPGEADMVDLKVEIERTLREVLAVGMMRGDTQQANMLWSAERHRVMLINFDRATRVPIPRRVWELRGKKWKQGAKDSHISHRKHSHISHRKHSHISHRKHRVRVNALLTSGGPA